MAKILGEALSSTVKRKALYKKVGGDLRVAVAQRAAKSAAKAKKDAETARKLKEEVKREARLTAETWKSPAGLGFVLGLRRAAGLEKAPLNLTAEAVSAAKAAAKVEAEHMAYVVMAYVVMAYIVIVMA